MAGNQPGSECGCAAAAGPVKVKNRNQPLLLKFGVSMKRLSLERAHWCDPLCVLRACVEGLQLGYFQTA